MSACVLQDGDSAKYSLAMEEHLEMFYFASIVKINLEFLKIFDHPISAFFLS